MLVNNAHYGRYVPTGHLIYEQDGSLFAVPFDEEKLELNGNPVRLPEKVACLCEFALERDYDVALAVS